MGLPPVALYPPPSIGGYGQQSQGVFGGYRPGGWNYGGYNGRQFQIQGIGYGPAGPRAFNIGGSSGARVIQGMGPYGPYGGFQQSSSGYIRIVP